jgi:signal transduction histidine kinase
MMRSGTTGEMDPGDGAKTMIAADRLLLDIIDTVREPLLVLDAEFRVTQTNRAFFRTFRVAPSDTLGKVLFDLGDGQWDIPPLRALLSDRLDAERELYDVDVDHVFPGIGRKIMLLNARLVSHDHDVPRVILLAIEDVTERRLAERRLAAQQRELERSNAALNEFAFVASHDLQEPLRKIVSFGERLETVAGHSLTGNARLYLDRMLTAAVRMRALIADLLSYSQIATSATPFAPTDLAAVTRGVLGDLEVSIAESGGRIDVRTLPTIDADASQIRQLFQNLLGNALKFRRPGVPPIVVVDAASSHNGDCTITVTDNGIGFKHEHGEKIFRMFERLHARNVYEGSGIGLAICRTIVERHGGTIDARSTIGQGTTFTVMLPITHIDEGSAP